MARIRVLIVEDSRTIRNRLCEILAANPHFEVVAEAEDGRRAIELCTKLKPDVVTMDMMLPVMSGLAATEYIMAYCPTPILIVSSSTNRGELFKTYEALAAGAVDVLEKPLGDEPDGSWEARLVAAVMLVSRIKVITHLRARLRMIGQPHQTEPPAEAQVSLQKRYGVVAIGASTGGPAAILQILRALPHPLSITVLVVLHINEPFGTALAEWLDGQTSNTARCAQEGDSLNACAGQVILAPPNRHLVIRENRLHLTLDAERYSCRPSVDVLFESVARELGPAACACLLTGMGRDGAAGLREIRRAGGLTIAQDEATSVVYGMPKEAVLLDAAERILPIDEIAATVCSIATRYTRDPHE
jgi:two-component system chemotaxis response regulator CheB